MIDPTRHTLRKTRTHRLATCSHCGSTRRVDMLTRRWFSAPKPGFIHETLVKETVKVNGLPLINTDARGLLQCCGSKLDFKAIRGRVTDHECGAKCMNAKSAPCECSCGGENHGKNHA